MPFSYSLVSTTLPLLILCAILYLVLKWAEKFKMKRFSGEMKVIDRLQVGPNQSLVIVKIRAKDYLLSVSKDVTLLKGLNEEVLD